MRDRGRGCASRRMSGREVTAGVMWQGSRGRRDVGRPPSFIVIVERELRSEGGRHRLDRSPRILEWGRVVVIPVAVTLSRLAGTRIFEPALRNLDVTNSGDGVHGIKAIEGRLAKVGGWRAVNGERLQRAGRTH